MDEFTCRSSAPPLPPTPVQNLTLSEPLHFPNGFDDVYIFTVHWEPPELGNGRLLESHIRVLDQAVSLYRRTGIEVRSWQPLS